MNQQLIILSQEELKETVENAVSKAFSKVSFPSNSKINTSEKLLLLTEAAARIKMPIPTFREYLARNEIKGAKIGKSWRFFPEDLDEFVKKHLRKTNDEIEKEIDDELSK